MQGLVQGEKRQGLTLKLLQVVIRPIRPANINASLASSVLFRSAASLRALANTALLPFGPQH
jgi:hypothetical protein